MKQVLVYLVGMVLLVPCCLMFTDNALVDVCGSIYTFVVFNSPCLSPKVKRFWRIWHKQNFKVLWLLLQIGKKA